MTDSRKWLGRELEGLRMERDSLRRQLVEALRQRDEWIKRRDEAQAQSAYLSSSLEEKEQVVRDLQDEVESLVAALEDRSPPKVEEGVLVQNPETV